VILQKIGIQFTIAFSLGRLGRGEVNIFEGVSGETFILPPVSSGLDLRGEFVALSQGGGSP
jgi:hypothetical protein